MDKMEQSLVKRYGKEPVEETKDILDMWRVIEASFRDLSGEEQENLVNMLEFGPKGIRFPGFDANNGPHYYIAKAFINEMGLWQFFANRRLNSHSPNLGMHRRMFRECKRVGGFPSLSRVLNLMRVLKARTHPSFRRSESKLPE